MENTESNNAASIGWDFLALFVLYIGILVGMAELSYGFMPAFRELTASAITVLWSILSVPVACSGTQVTFASFPMEIVLECTALHYMIIFIAGVLAFRSHTLSYRATGVIIGTLVIFLLNIFRVGVIGFIGRYLNTIFDFVHNYLWQGMFAICIVMLWVLWVNGKKVFSRRFIGLFVIATVSASLSFWLVVTFLEVYIALLAAISKIMFTTLSPFIDVPQRIIAEGRRIGYVFGNEVTYSDATLYVLNAALLLPIASITFVRSRAKLFLKRLCVAIILLGFQHLMIIALDWFLEVTRGPGIHSVIIWCMIMSAFIAPMLVWLVAMNILRAEPISDSSVSYP